MQLVWERHFGLVVGIWQLLDHVALSRQNEGFDVIPFVLVGEFLELFQFIRCHLQVVLWEVDVASNAVFDCLEKATFVGQLLYGRREVRVLGYLAVAFGEEVLFENLEHLLRVQGLAEALIILLLIGLAVEFLFVVAPSLNVNLLQVLEELAILLVINLFSQGSILTIDLSLDLSWNQSAVSMFS